MKDLESLVMDYFANLGMNPHRAKFILGLSGGLDSMVLAFVMKKLGAEILPVHCNFGLRSEADSDEQFVRDTLHSWQLPIQVEKYDTLGFANENKCSIQVAARHLRYESFGSLADKEDAIAILTAHHADDQTETLLMFFFRSKSPDLLRGIPSTRGNILRPFLSVRKKQIEQYALDNNIPWVEDESNRKNDYLRNKVRNEIIPLIEEVNPSFSELLVDRGNLYQNQMQLLDILLQEKASQYLSQEIETTVFDISIAREILGYEGAKIALGRHLKRSGWENALIPQVIELMNAETGKRVEGKAGLAIHDRQRILLERKTEGPILRATINESQANSFELDLGNTMFSMKKIEGRPQAFKPEILYLAGDKLKFPLVLRKWLPGDRMIPLGMQQPKKLSDIFADEKVSIIHKSKTWVFTDQTEIVALMGFRISETRKIQENTPYHYEVKFS